MVINVMTRDVWHAEPPRVESMIIRKATHVFWMNVKRNVCYTKVHCIELLKRAQRYNMSIQNQRDIRYNFMVGGDGFVYEGRGWGQPPLLPREFARVNSESVVIGFMGFFNSVQELPNIMFKSGQTIVANGVRCRFIERDFIFHDFLVNKKRGDEDEQYKEIKQGRPVWYPKDPLANKFQRQGFKEEAKRLFPGRRG
ncbi:peptidoglycan-recognition protein SC2-like isoform X1 [Macrosteles quadrilineatus]|uniref:peptidoglycan-recognition protein SC2-like isoform X1 n=1 Tax=Macrosteles quadrilineatus TaxID=74068 RepID=UPI0023E1B13D|nr:peptidoglycan-recognition protein SC2-like isoform X1 [Macrosteles quadrilineatus]